MKTLIAVLALVLSTNAFAKAKVSVICDEDAHSAVLINTPTTDQKDESDLSPFHQTASFDGDLVLSYLDKDEDMTGNEYDCTLHKDESSASLTVYVCSQDGYSGYKKLGLPKTLPQKGQAFTVPVVDVNFITVKDGWFSSHSEKKVYKSGSNCKVL